MDEKKRRKIVMHCGGVRCCTTAGKVLPWKRQPCAEQPPRWSRKSVVARCARMEMGVKNTHTHTHKLGKFKYLFQKFLVFIAVSLAWLVLCYVWVKRAGCACNNFTWSHLQFCVHIFEFWPRLKSGASRERPRRNTAKNVWHTHAHTLAEWIAAKSSKCHH